MSPLERKINELERRAQELHEQAHESAFAWHELEPEREQIREELRELRERHFEQSTSGQQRRDFRTHCTSTSSAPTLSLAPAVIGAGLMIVSAIALALQYFGVLFP